MVYCLSFPKNNSKGKSCSWSLRVGEAWDLGMVLLGGEGHRVDIGTEGRYG